VVHHAAEAKRLAAGLIAVACLAVVGLAGCGGDDPPADQGIGANTPLRLADCDDWNSSGVEERLVTVEQLATFNAGSSDVARGVVLDDDQAYDILDGQCSAEFAGAFKIYKLYGRAAAFLGH
jgi:hypothetical protein